MPRTYHKKGVHTSPQRAGLQLVKNVDLPKDELNIMGKIMPVREHGMKENTRYQGLWTDEEFKQSVNDFFTYCNEVSLKPSRPALQLWLGVSRQHYFDWRTKPEKYGVKSDILETAEQVMELYLMSNIDSYPTGSIFLLKAGHGYRDTQSIEINASQSVKPDEIAGTISALGLDAVNDETEDTCEAP